MIRIKKQFAIAVLAVLLIAAPPAARGQSPQKEQSVPQGKTYALALHGGAGASPEKMSEEERAAYERALTEALNLGKKILDEGGTSLDAVERVIRYLEDEALFNAGRGAVFNNAEGHELDASIMDGSNRDCGAVAGVRTVKNPISLARLVMTKTPHVLLAADGADKFAREMKVEIVEQSYFSTEKRRESLKRAQQKNLEQKNDGQDDADKKHMGTVGCVALDRHGNLAAGTSTGGLTNKMYGRVGDSPIIGAGTYADNATCAASGTGIGEHFIRNAVAYDLSARMAYRGQSLREAVDAVIHHTLKPGYGGIIAVDHNGEIVMDFNTPGMARAAADSTGLFEVALGR